jgi:hypothetical protein
VQGEFPRAPRAGEETAVVGDRFDVDEKHAVDIRR